MLIKNLNRTYYMSSTLHGILQILIHGPGAMAQFARCSLCKSQDHTLLPVCVLAGLLPPPVQLPACSLGRQWMMAQGLGTPHSSGKPRGISWLMTSDQLSTGHCSHLWNEPVDGRNCPLFIKSDLPFE